MASYSLGLSGRESLRPHLLYNTGRIITYTFIGALMGLGGSFVDTAASLKGVSSTVSVLAGLFMVFMGASVLIRMRSVSGIEGPWGPVVKATDIILKSRSSSKFFPLGLMLGFIPCGLSYSMFLASAATGDALKGMALAFSFGLGTVPVLFAFGVMVSAIGPHIRGLLYRASGALVVVMGVMFIVRGFKG